MPFVSSFLSVHLSERTELSRPLTCSPSPYHFERAVVLSVGYVVSVLPTAFTSPPLFFDAIFEEKERREEEERAMRHGGRRETRKRQFHWNRMRAEELTRADL